jgi:hypothetical protein
MKMGAAKIGVAAVSMKAELRRTAGIGNGCPANETGQVDVKNPRMALLSRGRIYF